jgi:hypothetical protein
MPEWRRQTRTPGLRIRVPNLTDPSLTRGFAGLELCFDELDFKSDRHFITHQNSASFQRTKLPGC